MLQLATVLPGSRRSLRRAVSLKADVIAASWPDACRPHRVLDLSPEGMRVASGTRAPVDDVVAVSFTPPGWWLSGELTLFSRVVRTAPRIGESPAWMAFEFLDMPAGASQQLARTLRHRPPPIPARRRRSLRRELVWVDMLVTYEEDLGDRVNTLEVSELVAAVADDDLEVQSLSGLLTGSRRAYQWQTPVADQLCR